MVASFTPAKTKHAPVSSCIMEHNNRAAVVLEFRVADVTGAFSCWGGISTSFSWETVKHQQSGHADSKADLQYLYIFHI